MKVLSLFSGIGAFEKALTNMGVNYELVNFSEIDKYAVKSYCAIHNVSESLNLGDITKVDSKLLPKNIDLLTYGFPCQDISLAGKQKGLFNEDGTQTRSGLFFEALRIIEDVKPKVAIAENVKNLTKKFSGQFEIVLNSLEQAGYNNYWLVLNAKDYGVPQNRERVFIISIRKDIDKGFNFPKPFELQLRLKDLLESEVDDKYYLSGKGVEYVLSPKRGMCTDVNADIAQTLTTQSNWTGSFISDSIEKIEKVSTIGSKKPVIIYLKKQEDTNKCIKVADLNRYNNDQMNRVYSPEGIAPTQMTKSGGNRETKILINWGKNKNVSLDTYIKKAIKSNVDLPCAVDEQNVCIRTDGLVATIVTDGSSPKHNNRVLLEDLSVRKLTPLECFRLMGFDDEDFYKAEKVNSNTQLYKQAGNSIVVDVIEEIYEQLFNLYWEELK